MESAPGPGPPLAQPQPDTAARDSSITEHPALGGAPSAPETALGTAAIAAAVAAAVDGSAAYGAVGACSAVTAFPRSATAPAGLGPGLTEDMSGLDAVPGDAGPSESAAAPAAGQPGAAAHGGPGQDRQSATGNAPASRPAESPAAGLPDGAQAAPSNAGEAAWAHGGNYNTAQRPIYQAPEVTAQGVVQLCYAYSYLRHVILSLLASYC